MTVTQVGRDINGVTINVSGITKGDRQTYIWIPESLLNTSVGKWFTLTEARDRRYVTGIYVADYNTNNGDITVWVSEEYYSKFKVIGLYVKNGINIDTPNEVIYSQTPTLYTILDFQYENSKEKVQGAEIDITVSDMRGLNLFGIDVYAWIHPDPVDDPDNYGWYPLDDVIAGDEIYADYLRAPAKLICETAYKLKDYIEPNYSNSYIRIMDIVNNCVSGAEFKAEWFNDIVEAIRDFNLSITV